MRPINRKASLVAALAGLVAGLAGCGYTDLYEVPLRAASDAPRSRVDVYMIDQTPPARPVHDIALVQAMGYGSDASMESLVSTLRARAGALGCDALYRVHVEQGYTMAHGYGVCVKFASTETGAAPSASRPAAAPAPRVIPPRPVAPPPPPPPPPPPETDDDAASF